MNEEQRKASGQVSSSDKKSEKDYSQYFEAVYIPPSLKDAKKRGKEEVEYNQFQIDEQLTLPNLLSLLANSSMARRNSFLRKSGQRVSVK